MIDQLVMPRDVVDEVVAHCVEGRPHEACGLLAARDGAIVKVYRMTNAAASPVRYELDPREQLAVYNAIEEQGWQLGGVFHSHTRTAAYPSPTDIRLAAEDVPYLIVSLVEQPAVIKAFRIRKQNWTDESGEVTEIPLVVGTAGPPRDSVDFR